MDETLPSCPRCGHEPLLVTPGERAWVAAGGLCQGCRAARTLRRRPWLLAQFVSAWDVTDYPGSPTWLTGLPSHRA
jgi:hypothetical protein